ncbi:hypothetical protein [Streptomyces sp. NPDC050355]|uniref:hypothetical protein n=1 Tax=Streptomyces sp. NPDC050355 TaxID=3365609 RepID=UPI0037ACD31C
MEAWRRLGGDGDAAAEMAEELAADLTAAARDGRDPGAYIGDDVDALATSWAVHLAPAREATVRALTRTLPLDIVAAALVGGVIVGLLGSYVFG